MCVCVCVHPMSSLESRQAQPRLALPTAAAAAAQARGSGTRPSSGAPFLWNLGSAGVTQATAAGWIYPLALSRDGGACRRVDLRYGIYREDLSVGVGSFVCRQRSTHAGTHTHSKPSRRPYPCAHHCTAGSAVLPWWCGCVCSVGCRGWCELSGTAVGGPVSAIGCGGGSYFVG